MNTKQKDDTHIRRPNYDTVASVLLLLLVVLSTSCKPSYHTDDEKLKRDQSILRSLELSGGTFIPSSRNHDPVLEILQDDGYRTYENDNYFVFFSNKYDTVFSVEGKDTVDRDQHDHQGDETFFEAEAIRLYKAMQEKDLPEMEAEQIDLHTGDLIRIELKEYEDDIPIGTAGAFTFEASGKLCLAAIYEERVSEAKREGYKESNITERIALDIAKTVVLADEKLNQYKWDFLPMQSMPKIEANQGTLEWRVDIPVAIHGELEGTSQALTVYLDAETGKTNAVFSTLN